MTVPLRYSANLSMLFTELPLLRRPAAAAEAGFDAVEIWWPFAAAVPADSELEAFARAVQDAGVQLVGLNFFAGDMPGGDRGVLSIPGRSAEFRENVAVAVELGARLGCRAFNALYGNRVDEAQPQEQDAVAQDNLVLAADATAGVGAVVLVEAVSGAPRYPLRTVADVLGVIERAEDETSVTNLRLLLDLYHLAVNGDDLQAAVSVQVDRIGHVQIADAPGRHEPGTGNLDIDRYLGQLTAEGYRGYVGLEYKPRGETGAGLGWLPRQRRSSRNRASTGPLEPRLANESAC